MSIRTLLLAAALCIASLALAQPSPGTWRTIATFAPPAKAVAETPRSVYFAASGSLFEYNKSDDTNRALTADDGLSGTGEITLLRYLPRHELLVVGYEDGAVDLIGADGTVRCFSDIRDSGVDSPAPRDVTADASRIYFATDFGMVSVDASTLLVDSYAIYNRPIAALTIDAGQLLFADADGNLYKGSTTPLPRRFESLRSVGNVAGACELHTLSDYKVLVRSKYFTCIATADVWGAYYGGTQTPGAASQLSIASDGTARFASNGTLYRATSDGISVECPLPADIAGDLISSTSGAASVWALGSNGLTHLARGADGNWSVLMQRFRPEAVNVAEVGYIIPGTDPLRLYFTNLGPTNYRVGETQGTDALDKPQATALLTADGWQDVTPGDPPHSPARLAEDPDNPSVYYLATGFYGLKVVEDGKVVGVYDDSNTPLYNGWGSRVYEVSMDAAGNMWVGARGYTHDRSIMVLPAAKRRLGPAAVTIADWNVLPLEPYAFNKDIRIYHCRHSPVTFIFDAGSDHILVAYGTNGTPDNFADDTWRIYDSFTDQDGQRFEPARITSVVEDASGSVWLGTSSGVIEIPSPADALGASLTVRRLKVNHDDGTGLADYLAETDVIFDISIDAAGRRWIATEQSGIYVVSADGGEIVQNFNSSNSPLPSDRVNAVYCSPLTRSVYVATSAGLLEYGNTAGPAATEMSTLNVFPNPFLPAEVGEVSIEGLTDGALVKITDAAGAVVWQHRAEGGAVRWNGETAAGRPAASGVYFILASPAASAGGSASSPSASGKLLLVR